MPEPDREAFADAWRASRARVESALCAAFDQRPEIPDTLLAAMRYATLDGGKRFRAMLVYVAGEHLAGSTPAAPAALDAIAAAVEMIHAYSLVHDDLPAMDDDDLRRGRPTCHRAFDEATAILAGDALQALAFELLAGDDLASVSAGRRLEMIQRLATGAGAMGMVGGQNLDMEATGLATEMPALQRMHGLKTGALIRSSCVLGGLAVPDIVVDRLDALDRYGEALGMAFQIADDILDVTADSDTLGKTSGADNRMQKATFVSLLGIEGALCERDRWHRLALETADLLGDNGGLFHQLADFVVERRY